VLLVVAALRMRQTEPPFRRLLWIAIVLAALTIAMLIVVTVAILNTKSN